MRAARIRKKINKWRSRFGTVSPQWPLAVLSVCSRWTLGLAAGILPCCSFSMSRASRQPSWAWEATCGPEGLGAAGGSLCWVWTLWRWENLVSSWDGATGLLTCRRVSRLSFSTLLRNHLILPQMNHLPESQILLQEYGDRLAFHFSIYP